MLQAQIFIDKDEMRDGQPLHEWIMRFLLAQGVAGATAFRGIAGFGHAHQLKRPDRLFSFDVPPVMITCIDDEARLRAALAALREQVKSGFIAIGHVEPW
jgi:PII-like signaling protein